MLGYNAVHKVSHGSHGCRHGVENSELAKTSHGYPAVAMAKVIVRWKRTLSEIEPY